MTDWLAIKTSLGLGKNTKNHRVRNEIIRRHFVGGEDLLTALPLIDRLVRRLKDSGHPHQAAAALAALNELRRVSEMMHAAADVWIDDFK